MMSWWRKRRPTLDNTPYHVRQADISARQLGAYMLIAAAAIAPLLLRPWNPVADRRLLAGATAAAFSIGAALFTFGELLRRRRQAWAAHALVALAGSLVLGCAGVLAAAAALGVRWATASSCVAVFGLLFAWPVLWHAFRAARELRAAPTAWTTGFGPIVHTAPLPVKPLAEQDDADFIRGFDLDAPGAVLPVDDNPREDVRP